MLLKLITGVFALCLANTVTLSPLPSPYIINGHNFTGSLPLVVSIHDDEDFLGSGVIIHQDWVVTVAHLFDNMDDEYD